jgi:hypothetical protein
METLAKKFAYAVAVVESPGADFYQVRGRAHSLYIGSKVETDTEFTDWLGQAITSDEVAHAVKSSQNLNKFENEFTDWILSHKSNRLHGLKQFEPDYSEGSTQAFDSFYFRHRQRQFRCFVGEYFYHIKTWQANSADWSWLGSVEDLQPGDALVLSIPFCDTVLQRDNYNNLMTRCCELGIPVLLDLCYYIISNDLDIDLNYKCIDTVAFSLSKAWPVSAARIGIRYTRPTVFDGQKLHHSIGYNNNLGALVGSKIINHYSADWIYNQRKTKYTKVCKVLDLMPTQSVCFATGDSNWNQYSRKELLRSYQLDFDPELFVNRICLNKIYQHWDLFCRFILDETGINI